MRVRQLEDSKKTTWRCLYRVVQLRVAPTGPMNQGHILLEADDTPKPLRVVMVLHLASLCNLCTIAISFGACSQLL